MFTIMDFFDLIGTIAFALSGAAVAIRKKMDVFGVNILAITTACGGGLLRDLIIGNTPPNMFRNPFYVIISAISANLFFIVAYQQRESYGKMGHFYDTILFWFDTLGLAAFTVGGIIVGVDAGYHENEFLLVFLGFLTGVGGGVLRDMMANELPYIFVRHVYALAAISGAILMVLTFDIYGDRNLAMIFGFALIIVLRYMAVRFDWNLPRVE